MTYAEELSVRRGMTRCSACTGKCPVIPPDGPPNARIMFIGEKPGKEENSRGRCFVGKTGKEFNDHYLPLCGTDRNSVWVTNTAKCFDADTDDPEVVATCARHHLAQEIHRVRPSLLVPMGGVAASLVEGLNLEMNHGIPIEGMAMYGHPVSIFPMYHPARGLHDTAFMLPLRLDFQTLGRYLNGQDTTSKDEFAGREDYREITRESGLLTLIDSRQPLAVDTESDPVTGFWCLSFSQRAGTGYLIRRANGPLVQLFAYLIKSHRAPIVFHNGMYDVPVLEQVGIHVPMRLFDDTMVRAYHLGWLPQGLKFLAYRLCGMEMEEFEDVVLPYSIDIMTQYILKLAEVDWPKPSEQLITGKDGVELKLYKPQGLNTKCKRLLTDFHKKPTHKVFDRWKQWSDEEKWPAIVRFGDMPMASIAHVPMAKALFYACRDADATIRVRSELTKYKRQIRRPQ